MATHVLHRHWLSLSCFLGVICATIAKGDPFVSVEAVDVLPGGLPKTGYWHKEYNDRCGADLFEAHGANAGMSFTFIGSGFVARLLSCETCSPVEIRIDECKEPITVDLSDRGFRCPTGSPVFTKTDLVHGMHTIRIKRLEEGKPLKVMKFEYLTHAPPTPSSGESGESSSPPPLPDSPQIAFSAAADTAGKAGSSIATSAMKSAARVVAKQAAGIAMSYAVMTGAKLVAKAAMGYVAGGTMGDIVADGLTGAMSDGGEDFSVAGDGGGWFDTAGVDGSVDTGGLVDGDMPVDGGDISDVLVDILSGIAATLF
ncbi:hypothetical protein PLEOSDRAFT_1114327 [Pleurotus ostreatus PC15]|uniref:Expansin-like EG45 domain-containing protein n=1 Tax=Pleurotus ostreatus (strain PC15) TaxID=1137138 RepID=A0A067N895_PLEO1|nr:hypothetical protein PLEOSDRAFT_1114327 [Pleurotus ostreatus PC15]